MSKKSALVEQVWWFAAEETNDKIGLGTVIRCDEVEGLVREDYSVPSAKSPEVLRSDTVSNNHSSLRPRLDPISSSFSGGSKFVGGLAGFTLHRFWAARMQSIPWRWLPPWCNLPPSANPRRGVCLGDFLPHFPYALSDSVLRSQSAIGCGPCPEYSGIDSPSRQGHSFPSREGQGGQKPVIDSCAAGGVLGFGSNSPDWQGDMVWHGLPASLCLLGHPFD